MRATTRLLPAVLAVGLIGCGGSGNPSHQDPADGPMHPVTGRVNYDGKPAAGVTVLFLPAYGGSTAKPVATTGADGTFTLTTATKDDGAPAGKYRVVLRWPPEQHDDDLEEAEIDRLLGWYEPGTTTLMIEVKAGPNALPPFNLPKRDTQAGEVPGIPGMN